MKRKKEFEGIIHPIFAKFSGGAGPQAGEGFDTDEMPSHDDL